MPSRSLSAKSRPWDCPQIGSTGASGLPIAFFGKGSVFKTRCQGFPNPDGILRRVKERRRTAGTPINGEITLKQA
jgi:hypothetical protein